MITLICFLLLDPPSKPASVHVSRSTEEDLTVEWKPPTNDGGTRVKKYAVQV